MSGKKAIWKSVWYICALSLLVGLSNIPIVKSINVTTGEMVCGDDAYYNATVAIISNLYRVSNHTEEEIILRDFRIPFLIGIFYISDKNGVRECNFGGWMNSKVTITGFDGFFKDWVFDKWGVYVIVWGECDKVRVQTFR